MSHPHNLPSTSAPLVDGHLTSTAASSVINSPMSVSSGSAVASPKTPAEDRLKKKLYRRNGKGETQLHRAAIKGNQALCKKLLAMGIDPNVTDHAGYTPLHEACNRGNAAIVKVLVKKGADVNVFGGVGDMRETPLHDAARNGHLAVREP